MDLLEFIAAIFFWTLLILDGIVFSIIAYSFKLFQIVSELNYNVVYSMFGGLINRVQSLIIVYIVYKIAILLIGYLINPDSLSQSGKKASGPQLLINIFTATVLLAVSGFVFSLLSDISLLIIGTNQGVAQYEVINPVENDGQGLIARVFFGTDYPTDNWGKMLALSTLNIFLSDAPEGLEESCDDCKTVSEVFGELNANSDKEFDFLRITELSSSILHGVHYRFPILSTTVGLFMIFTIIKTTMEVAVRMFKLVVLQLIAPIPIISIISDGIKGEKFTKYISTYIKTYTDAFIRIATLFVVTGMLGIIDSMITDGTLLGQLDDVGALTKSFVLLILIIGGYMFVIKLPDFLNSLFPGLNIDGASFGKTLKQVAGVGASVAGGVAGFAAGKAAGNGNMASLFNAVSTGRNMYKNPGQVLNSGSVAMANALRTNAAGGLRGRISNTIGNATGSTALRNKRDNDIIESNNNAIAAAMQARDNELANNKAALNKAAAERDSKLQENRQNLEKSRASYQSSIDELNNRKEQIAEIMGNKADRCNSAALQNKEYNDWVEIRDDYLAKGDIDSARAANDEANNAYNKAYEFAEKNYDQEFETRYNDKYDSSIADDANKIKNMQNQILAAEQSAASNEQTINAEYAKAEQDYEHKNAEANRTFTQVETSMKQDNQTRQREIERREVV